MQFKWMHRCVLIAGFVLMLVLPIHAKPKDRAWHGGVLLDSSTERGSRLFSVNGDIYSGRNDVTHYEIDDGKMLFVVARIIRHKRDKPIDVTINGHVQFAIDGSKCYLLDANGKEYELSVDKKVLKEQQK